VIWAVVPQSERSAQADAENVSATLTEVINAKDVLSDIGVMTAGQNKLPAS
jgi:hypothetical protein